MVERQPGSANSAINPTFVPLHVLLGNHQRFFLPSTSVSIWLLSSYALARQGCASGNGNASMVRIRFRLPLDETRGLSSRKLDLDD